MKIGICVLALLLMLSGCSTPVYETLGNVIHVGQNDAVARQIMLAMPEDATVLTAVGSDLLYTCDGYTMSLQTLSSGDLAGTVRTISGYEMAQLTMVQTACTDHSRYDWVWVAAGEAGDVLCRAAVLDDGNFHYTLCVMADADAVPELNAAWNELFASFCLETEN